MTLRPATLSILSLLALTACGDSLLGGDWMDELLGLEEIPAEVAWELRWFAGPDNGLEIPCELQEPHTGLHALEEVFWGVAEVPPPEVTEVPEEWLVMEGDGFSWGLTLLVLAEPGPYHDADPQGERVDLDGSRGIWGVVEEYAVLVAHGDLERMHEELFVEPGDGLEELREGAQFVGFLPEVVLGTGSFAGSLWPVAFEEEEYIWGEGVPAVHLEYMEGFLWEVFEGEPYGGAHRQRCEED